MAATHERKRAAAGRLRDFLGRAQCSLSPLPLVHTTFAYSLADICMGDELSPSECRWFKEEILYLFYGRALYRASGYTSSSLEFNWPIIFVFDPNQITELRRVYPFDTGAFFLGLYKHFFSGQSKIEDFELDAELNSAGLIVDMFYGDNKTYYIGRSRKNLDIPNMQFEAQGIQDLSRQPGHQRIDSDGRRDSRSSAIEVQLGSPIKFSETILGIVIPQQYLQDAVIVSALERWGVKHIRYYEILNNESTDVWVGQIFEKLKQIYAECGLEEFSPGD